MTIRKYNYGVRSCLICGKEFAAAYSSQVVCSPECRKERSRFVDFRSHQPRRIMNSDFDCLNAKYEDLLHRYRKLVSAGAPDGDTADADLEWLNSVCERLIRSETESKNECRELADALAALRGDLDKAREDEDALKAEAEESARIRGDLAQALAEKEAASGELAKARAEAEMNVERLARAEKELAETKEELAKTEKELEDEKSLKNVLACAREAGNLQAAPREGQKESAAFQALPVAGKPERKRGRPRKTDGNGGLMPEKSGAASGTPLKKPGAKPPSGKGGSFMPFGSMLRDTAAGKGKPFNPEALLKSLEAQHTRICANCGTSFYGRDLSEPYCCPECRLQAVRKRKGK